MKSTGRKNEAQKLFFASASQAAAGDGKSYVLGVLSRIRVGALYRSVIRFWHAARRTLLVSRIIRWTAVILAAIESGAAAIVTGAIFLLAIPAALFTFCVFWLISAYDAGKKLPRLASLCRDRCVVLVHQKCGKLDAYSGDGRLVIRVAHDVRALLRNMRERDGEITLSAYFCVRARHCVCKSAARVIDVY